MGGHPGRRHGSESGLVGGGWPQRRGVERVLERRKGNVIDDGSEARRMVPVLVIWGRRNEGSVLGLSMKVHDGRMSVASTVWLVGIRLVPMGLGCLVVVAIDRSSGRRVSATTPVGWSGGRRTIASG